VGVTETVTSCSAMDNRVVLGCSDGQIIVCKLHDNLRQADPIATWREHFAIRGTLWKRLLNDDRLVVFGTAVKFYRLVANDNDNDDEVLLGRVNFEHAGDSGVVQDFDESARGVCASLANGAVQIWKPMVS